MELVDMEYRFSVVAGRATSGCDTLAEQAQRIGKAFYGDHAFKVEVEVSGKPDSYFVQCVARAEIEVR